MFVFLNITFYSVICFRSLGSNCDFRQELLVVLTSLQQWVQEILESVGEAAHHVTGVAVLREEEGELEVGILLQLDLSAVAPRQLIRRVLRHRHHMVNQLLDTNSE